MLNETESPLYCQKYLDKIQSLSLDNKYTRWYIRLCRKAALRCRYRAAAKRLLGYIESHHVVPRSFKLGGGKDKDNLVHFTAREHFISHLLLTKMFEKGRKRSLMLLALECMSVFGHERKKINNGRWYQRLREEIILAKSITRKGVPPTKKMIEGYEKRKNREPTPLEKEEYERRKTNPRTPAQIAANLAQRGKPHTEKQRMGYDKVREQHRERLIARNRANVGVTRLVLMGEPHTLPAGVDAEATALEFGYNPRYLKPQSTKKVIRNCQFCGSVKITTLNKANYIDYCSRECLVRTTTASKPPKPEVVRINGKTMAQIQGNLKRKGVKRGPYAIAEISKLPSWILVKETIHEHGIDPNLTNPHSCFKVVCKCALCGKLESKSMNNARATKYCRSCAAHLMWARRRTQPNNEDCTGGQKK